RSSSLEYGAVYSLTFVFFESGRRIRPGIFPLPSWSTVYGWPRMIPIRTLLAATALVTTGGVAARQVERVGPASHGERLFQQCSGRHSVDTGEKRVGPSLKGLFHKHELANGT